MEAAEQKRLIGAIKNKIKALGYEEFTGTDDALIDTAFWDASEHIKNICNIGAIPRGLEHVLCDMVCGEFLYQRYAAGKLPETFVFETPVASISEGDVSISFASGGAQSAEQRFLAYVNKLRKPDKSCFVRYRKVSW